MMSMTPMHMPMFSYVENQHGHHADDDELTSLSLVKGQNSMR
ncbi:MAG: hypothetical protein ACLUI3_03700 [Christensenellales bacterium]